MKFIKHEVVKQFMHDILKKKNLKKEYADYVVNGLIETSLRGVDSHGVRLFPHYIKAIESGRINTNPNISIKQNSNSTALIDADSTFGHVSGMVATKKAIELAKSNGMASVGVFNSTHFGAAAYFALEIAKNNMIGLSFTHADALVAPYNGKKSLFGTNPICFAAKGVGDDMFCLDMSTSQVSYNKVMTYKEDAKEIELGWGVDSNGLDVTDPSAVNSLKPSGLYKGQGLGMMVEILCALLTGAPFDHELSKMFADPIEKKRELGHFFIAIDITSFQNIDNFQERISSLMNIVRGQESISDIPVMASGDPEVKAYNDRFHNGLPMKDFDYNEFKKLANEFNEEWI